MDSSEEFVGKRRFLSGKIVYWYVVNNGKTIQYFLIQCCLLCMGWILCWYIRSIASRVYIQLFEKTVFTEYTVSLYRTSTGGDGTVRETVTRACKPPGAETRTFDPGLKSATSREFHTIHNTQYTTTHPRPPSDLVDNGYYLHLQNQQRVTSSQ